MNVYIDTQMEFLRLLNEAIPATYEEDTIDNVIICGSRDWKSGTVIRKSLVVLASRNRNVKIIHGACRGADRITDTIAKNLGLQVEGIPANWVGRGKIAGRERNLLMLSLSPDLVLAFKNDFDDTFSHGGTENMCEIALESGRPVLHFSTYKGWRILTK